MLHRDWIRHNFRREKLREAWDEFFSHWDVLLCPQFTVPAIPHDQRPLKNVGRTRSYDAILGWHCGGVTLTQYGLSVGVGEDGLPIGLQLISGPYQDFDY